MKLLLTLLTTLASLSLYAKEPRHMVTFGSHGLGWSGTVEQMHTNSDSAFKNINYFLSNLSLNYAYRFYPRFQLGGFLRSSHSEYKFVRRDGRTSPQETETNSVGLFVLYNFHDQIQDSYYVGLSASHTIHEEEISHDFNDAEGKAALEVDDETQTYELIFGRRFPLVMMDFRNFSFSPQLRVFYQTHGRDFDDQDIKYGLGATLELIRFDLLF